MVKHGDSTVEKAGLLKVCQFAKLKNESIDALFNYSGDETTVNWTKFVALAIA
jgi:hypothetical protein